MSDRPRIVLGLGVFLALAAYPIWSALAADRSPAQPVLARAVDPTGCVEDTAWMAANHQELLNDWRTAVVRRGEHEYVSTSGVTHEMSLTGTCLQCHGDAEAFCETCHEYAGVTPGCWSCHVGAGGR